MVTESLLVAPDVADNTNLLLDTLCARSPEARRRIINELVTTLTVTQRGDLDPADRQIILADVPLSPDFSSAFKHVPGHASPLKNRACVQLIAQLCSLDQLAPSARTERQAAYEANVRTLRDAGTIKALVQSLKLINLDHPKATRAVQAVLRPLEVLSRSTWAPKAAAPANAAAADHGTGGPSHGLFDALMAAAGGDPTQPVQVSTPGYLPCLVQLRPSLPTVGFHLILWRRTDPIF